MTPLTPEQQDAHRLERARQDLQDIAELRSSTGFNRWFMGRVNRKIEELETAILEEQADTASIDRKQRELVVERNRARRGVLLDLKNWLGADEKSARAEVERG